MSEPPKKRMPADDASRQFFAPQAIERRKSRFQRFLAREFTQCLLKTFGAFLNSRNAKLYLACRPDSHFGFDDFPDFARLYSDFTQQWWGTCRGSTCCS